MSKPLIDLGWLARATLRLTTPAALAYGLSLLGFTWQATRAGITNDIGLYVWVDGNSHDLARTLILYIGEAAGEEGLLGRIRNERSWVTLNHVHGHARTMLRRAAVPIGGLVTFSGLPDDSLRDVYEQVRGIRPEPSEAIRWLNETAAGHELAVVERIAVRLAVHLGDTGAPVNSQFAGAWDNKARKARNVDMLAILAYEKMRAEAIAVGDDPA